MFFTSILGRPDHSLSDKKPPERSSLFYRSTEIFSMIEVDGYGTGTPTSSSDRTVRSGGGTFRGRQGVWWKMDGSNTSDQVDEQPTILYPLRLSTDPEKRENWREVDDMRHETRDFSTISRCLFSVVCTVTRCLSYIVS